MTPQPIGAGAYGIEPGRTTQGRRLDLAKFQQDITQALNAEEARALNEHFGEPSRAVKSRPVADSGAVLGRHIDIQA